MTTTNPLLDFSGLPRFDAVRPEHVTPAIAELLAENRALLARLETAPATWADFAAPFFDGAERLSRAWGVVGHLHSVMDVPEWREAYNANLPEVTRFFAELGQNQHLFAQFKALKAGPGYAQLSAAQQRIVEHEIRDFRLSGAELPEADKPRFQAIQEELASLQAKFSENLLDATNAFAEIVTDEAELAGIPADVVEAARAAAEKDGKQGWKFTLHMPSYLPAMQYAESRRLREALYRAYATRAAEFHDLAGKPEWDNMPLIRRILALRAEEAGHLGYGNFAEVSLVPKMAESPADVLAFLRELAQKSKPFAERDMAELREFAVSQGLTSLEPWDIGWVSEKLKQARHGFSDEEVRRYFPEHKVLAGLFRVIETLFAVRIRPDTAPVWHEDVRFFRIEDTAGALVGQFYLDLYARETKRGGAWMDDAVTRRRTATGIQTPVAYLNCNFSRPVGEKDGKKRPALFTHDEVITLFHETGHGLHHLLTRVEELGVSGINGVEWDAVELPSQFMENFCWEWEVLTGMTAHVDSGEPLPRALFDRMTAAKNFQGGMQIARQLEFSLFDLLLHSDFEPAGQKSVLELIEEVRQEVAVVFPPPWHRFPNSFSHIFAGGYAAGYYSYKWAEVLSADAFAAFEEERAAGSVLNPATGARFRDEILAVGGSRPALESFKAFRGRAPSVDALLRHSGMILA
ncbi:MAG: oligopeptidase A [Rhodocyclaceae bacterium]|jgi:oligopeptidase A|uniref:oligopeptidase A n=1 Tax=Candidatus Desulfobacillus denitrificans TaxID=2608985 RepID=A0A809R2G9_9PROT|nr:M3 family metallopeptidase [Candidatus Desulfobacillus denitrificans]GIK45174.1 MAG: oligopeptidase A [Betaproteobacteria bacterium]GJQ55653.1 MAG: oligopeptidase A [Rhodocyclaceae bacterium]